MLRRLRRAQSARAEDVAVLAACADVTVVIAVGKLGTDRIAPVVEYAVTRRARGPSPPALPATAGWYSVCASGLDELAVAALPTCERVESQTVVMRLRNTRSQSLAPRRVPAEGIVAGRRRPDLIGISIGTTGEARFVARSVGMTVIGFRRLIVGQLTALIADLAVLLRTRTCRAPIGRLRCALRVVDAGASVVDVATSGGE